VFAPYPSGWVEGRRLRSIDVAEDFMTTATLVTSLFLVSTAVATLVLLARTNRRLRAAGAPALLVELEDQDVDQALRRTLGPSLQPESCANWCERSDCGSGCFASLGGAPEGCLLHLRLAAWYRNRSCSLCGNPFQDDVQAWDRRPAFLSPDLVARTWDSVHPQELAHVLATHMPICWDCEVLEWLYRNHPELIVERPGRQPEER
jgi:hypothetical protein